ncbi:hypothetical protein PCH_Pc21g22700 [Penicillium rubens Wisconsin 54-1255]|uniref:Uncharacterized protein n=1 Tax=Penicillium rubens (strain ATCC 28089 / DSM 1075 / NRRL 1951 / Wisconsin 54-1255) TaxID=500485 RepID=B6HNX2_PENRW|nr:hypothetical protein PCH_Pc21g22700 [Penicillium rubens Wisconsin 54-1255]
MALHKLNPERLKRRLPEYSRNCQDRAVPGRSECTSGSETGIFIPRELFPATKKAGSPSPIGVVPPPTGGPTGKVLSHWLFPLESAKLDDDWSNSLASSSTPVVQQPAIFAGNSLSNGIITLFDQ